MDTEQKEVLTQSLKDKLRITWNNEKTDRELSETVENAEAYLNHMLGAAVDYTTPGIEKMLFLNLCMYMWNDCQDEFEEAYQKDILRCRAIYEVKANEEEEDTGTE